MNTCPLCQESNTRQLDSSPQFYRCDHCSTVFRGAHHWLSPEAEKERYLLHENDVEDQGYQQFVSPMVEKVCQLFSEPAKGLDFGAGTGPVISKLLTDKGFEIRLWDPFFHTDVTALQTHYDFIVCCEVIEHLNTPIAEFQLMKNLLASGGKLLCMTDLLPKMELFETWHYKNDPSHVIFYSEKNLNWIKECFKFSEMTIEGRLIIFSS